MHDRHILYTVYEMHDLEYHSTRAQMA